MNRSLTTILLTIIATAAMSATAAHAATVLVFGVDYAYEDAGNPQDVFTGHQEASGPNTNGAVPHVTTDGTITASLSGTDSSGDAQFQYRAPGQTDRFNVNGTSVDDLIEDLVAARDSATSAVTGNMKLTLTGLAAGTYDFISYHNENVDVGAGFSTGQTITAFIGAANMGSVVPLNLSSNGAANSNTDADIRSSAFQIVSDGINPIVIDYTAKTALDADAFMFINGFTITAEVSDVPTPAALPAALAMLALAAARRRRLA